MEKLKNINLPFKKGDKWFAYILGVITKIEFSNVWIDLNQENDVKQVCANWTLNHESFPENAVKRFLFKGGTRYREREDETEGKWEYSHSSYGGTLKVKKNEDLTKPLTISIWANETYYEVSIYSNLQDLMKKEQENLLKQAVQIEK